MDEINCTWDHRPEEEVPATMELYDTMEEKWTPACDECAEDNVAERRGLDEGTD